MLGYRSAPYPLQLVRYRRARFLNGNLAKSPSEKIFTKCHNDFHGCRSTAIRLNIGLENLVRPAMVLLDVPSLDQVQIGQNIAIETIYRFIQFHNVTRIRKERKGKRERERVTDKIKQ